MLFFFFQNEITPPSIIGADNFLLSLSLIQSHGDEWTWVLLLPWLKAVTQHRDSGMLPERSIRMLVAHKHIVILHSFLQKYFDLNCSVSNYVF